MRPIFLVCVAIFGLLIMFTFTFSYFPEHGIVYASVNESSFEPFRVVTTVFDVNNSTGFVFTTVEVKNVTKFRLVNTSESNTVQEGYSQYAITFPEVDVRIGDEYKACTVIVKLMDLQCSIGFKSPGIRDGSVAFSVSDMNDNLGRYMK